MNDSLGDRMKASYEDRTRYLLPRRTFTILRADGRAFHTFTRGCEKPYDLRVVAAMDAALLALCEEAQGASLGYVQSDELSVLLGDFSTISSEPWFGGNIQKVVSVAASIVTRAFNAVARQRGPASRLSEGTFDCRAFTIADPVEVENYFIWRQQDATRNSIQGLAQAHFSAKRLHGVNMAEAQELLFAEKGINWNDRPTGDKRGRCAVKTELGGWMIDDEVPIFTADRAYIRNRLPVRTD